MFFWFSLLVVLLSTPCLDARPRYLGQFKARYPETQEVAKKVECRVCHYYDKNKTVRNEFGEHFESYLGGKKVGDYDRIDLALKKSLRKEVAGQGGVRFIDHQHRIIAFGIERRFRRDHFTPEQP